MMIDVMSHDIFLESKKNPQEGYASWTQAHDGAKTRKCGFLQVHQSKTHFWIVPTLANSYVWTNFVLHYILQTSN